MLRKALKRWFQGEYPLFFWSLVLLGTSAWSATMVKSGLVYSFGMGFWGPNGHDGVWHIALINHLAKGLAAQAGLWQMPVFAGEVLKNYHLGYDLLLALINRLTGVTPIRLYFQAFPPLIAFLIGVLTYKFVLIWKKSRQQAFWATLFVYFGGSFGWLVTLLRSGQLGGESMFWAQQSISTLINPPFALSILLMLLGLTFLLRYKKSQATCYLLLATLVFGILIQIKVYAAVLSLGSLLVAGAYECILRKKTRLLKVFGGGFLVAVLLFFPINQGSQRLLVFKPFWFLETMMAMSDRFYWPRFAEAMVNYRLGAVWFKAIPAYLVAFLIFIVGNMGLRVIKAPLVFRWMKNFKKLDFVEVFLATVIAGGIVFPMFFLQKGTPWNTIQFFYYSLTFSGILAGIFLSEWLKKQKNTKKYLVAIGVLLFSVFNAVSTLRHYLPLRPPAKISNGELEALKFLSKQPEGIVLTYPFDRVAADAAASNPPRPLYLYESTAYVAAFSGKPVYLEDEVNLDITGYDWPARRKKVEEFLEAKDQSLARDFLKDNNISYIYWVVGQRASLAEKQLGFEKIFENDEVNIFEVIH
jgi:hypothetical protein